MKYLVEYKYPFGWNDAGWMDNKIFKDPERENESTPLRFNSSKDAQKAIDEFLESDAGSGRSEGYRASLAPESEAEYELIEVKKLLKEAESICFERGIEIQKWKCVGKQMYEALSVVKEAINEDNSMLADLLKNKIGYTIKVYEKLRSK